MRFGISSKPLDDNITLTEPYVYVYVCVCVCHRGWW